MGYVPPVYWLRGTELSDGELDDLETFKEIASNMMGCSIEKAESQFLLENPTQPLTSRNSIEGWLCKRVLELLRRL